ncbi:MAG TPA: tetratricopeptide repeat protein [Stellaceae bacterium]|nr:tetratricopeptide repeat protein [Stellaceae bacterium]
MRKFIAAAVALIAIQWAAPSVAQQPAPTNEEIQKRLDALPPEKRQKLLEQLKKAMANLELYADLQSGKCTRAPEVRIKALQGDPDSIYMLSDMYRNGWCVPKDVAQFHTNLEKAANLGVASAAFDLGYYLHNGDEGYPKDPKRAAGWFERAIKHGEPRAMVSLGSMLMEGDGLEKDIVRGLRLLNSAADQSTENLEASNRALSLLAIYYLTGQFIPRNLDAGRKYALRGAAQCDAGAMIVLGSFHQMISPPDLIQSYAWEYVAAEHGNEQQKAMAQSAMSDIGKQLPQNAITRAKAAAKKLPICVPTNSGVK